MEAPDQANAAAVQGITAPATSKTPLDEFEEAEEISQQQPGPIEATKVTEAPNQANAVAVQGITDPATL